MQQDKGYFAGDTYFEKFENGKLMTDTANSIAETS